MASSHLIRLGTIKGKDGILVAMKHNKRTLQKERGAGANIDATKMHLNYALHGLDTPEKIAIHARVHIAQAGLVNVRTNAVMGVEILFSLPIDRHQQDTKSFFVACYEWVKKSFAGELLSFDVHLDEAAPHAHAVILPLIDGKLQGRKMMGGKGDLMRLINTFHLDVARHFGLSRTDKKRLSNAAKEKIEREVLRRLKSDSVMNSCVWAIVRDLIKKDPMHFAQLLSITPPAKTKTKSFVDYKRAKGKGTFIK
jgi:hypothetical protein